MEVCLEQSVRIRLPALLVRLDSIHIVAPVRQDLLSRLWHNLGGLRARLGVLPRDPHQSNDREMGAVDEDE